MEQQEIIYRLQMMEQQMQQLQQQIQAVENGIAELDSLGRGLEEIPNSNGKEIFAQIGKGIYAKAKLVSEELLVNVGENNFVNKNVKDAKKLIGGQVEKLERIKGELEGGIEKTNNDFVEMIQEYQNSESAPNS